MPGYFGTFGDIVSFDVSSITNILQQHSTSHNPGINQGQSTNVGSANAIGVPQNSTTVQYVKFNLNFIVKPAYYNQNIPYSSNRIARHDNNQT